MEGFSRSMDTLARMEIIKAEIADLGFPILVEWHNSDWGMAQVGHDGRVKITIPHPINDLRTGIAFHEIGHVSLGHMTLQRAMDPDEKTIQASLRIEREACAFAESMMDKYGIDRSTLDPFQARYLEGIEKQVEIANMFNDILATLGSDRRV